MSALRRQKNIPDKSVARYQHISTCRWHKLWNGNLKWKNLNFTKSYCTTWIKQNNLSSYPNVWKCHLPKQNSLSNWPANWIVVKTNVSIDNNSVGWEQENQKTFWLYLCRADRKQANQSTFHNTCCGNSLSLDLYSTTQLWSLAVIWQWTHTTAHKTNACKHNFFLFQCFFSMCCSITSKAANSVRKNGNESPDWIFCLY